MEDKFRSMIVQLAGKIEEDELPMLKVALHDIINKAAELQKADGIQLFQLLQSGGNISYTDVSLLYELFDATDLKLLNDTVLHYYTKRPTNNTNKDISDFRRMLIKLGQTLESNDVKCIATLFGIMKRDSRNEWVLINSLTRQMKLNDDIETMEEFANRLSDQPGLQRVVSIVQEFVEQKKAKHMKQKKDKEVVNMGDGLKDE